MADCMVANCKKDLVMRDSGKMAFSAGRSYEMHPWFDGGLVAASNDFGEPHILPTTCLIEYFEEVPDNA